LTDWDRATYEALQEDVRASVPTPPPALEGRIAALETERDMLQESLDDVRASLAFENRGWTILGQFLAGETEGFTLEQLKEVSETIRPRISGTTLIKRGADLHTDYVFSRGVNIDGTQRPVGAGRPSELRKFYTNPVNQDNLFSATALATIQKARYSDGQIMLMADVANKTIRHLPLAQVTSIRVNPNDISEIWAYQHTWNPDPLNGQPRVRWYYTPRFQGAKRSSYTSGGIRVPVDQNIVVIDKKYNSQTGWAFGVPDAVAAMPWSEAYSEALQNGRVVSRALASLLFKITGNKTKAGVQNSAVKMAGMEGVGNGASMMEGQDAAAISTAGKGYDYDSADRLAGMVASSLNVSLTEILSDAGVAAGSYGASASLAPATLNAMKFMQREFVELLEAVFDFFKISVTKIWFDPIQDIDPYRSAQALKLLSDALSDEEYRGKALDYLDIAGVASTIPPLLASRSTVDTAPTVASQQSSPDQGVANGAGRANNSSDRRQDLVSEMAAQIQLDEMRGLVERFEAAASRLQ
jgi:hypothetical protein